jgi:8-amino-7-oxononanoate synthase
VTRLDFIADELGELERRGRRRRVRTVTARRGAEVVVDGRALVNFASNDYLGLGTDPRLARAAARAEAEHGVGAGASRLISGYTTVTAELERALADWVRRPASRLFNSGYSANTGIVPVLAGDGDVVFSDERNHASVIDGCRLARAAVEVYRHADPDDLRRRLHLRAGRRRFVVTESAFSMDGDCAPLAELVSVAHAAGAAVIVDDAHGLGVLGDDGAGLAAATGADIVVGTLGKAVGSAGAFVAGPESLIELLWNRARPLVYSTGLTIGTQAAALEGVAIARGPEGVARRARVVRLRALLEDRVGAELGERLRWASRGGSAIVPVILGGDRAAVQAATTLEDEGYWVPAIRPPTVPEGSARLRVTISAAHQDAHVEGLAASLHSLLG